MLLFVLFVEPEYWIESDQEIDEDVLEGATIPPADVSAEPSQDYAEINHIIRWMIALLSLFQTQFYLTNRALSWLLNFLFIVFCFFGRYSTKVAEIGRCFPRSLHQYGNLFSDIPIASFKRRAVCTSCESLYTFDECLKKIGTQTTIVPCKSKSFKKRCNNMLMRKVVSSNGTIKFYPHKVYCYISLISCLQILVNRNGFVALCESTRNQFSTSGLSDVYNGTLWNEFLMVNDVPFLTVS